MNLRTLPNPRPWYLEPWPWILMALPGTVVVGGLIAMVIAFAGADSLVADDYYKQGIGINKTLAREARARALGIVGEIRFEPGAVRASLAASVVLPPTIRLTLAHPTRASDDRFVLLARTAPGEYAAPLAELPAGRWDVVLETADWRLTAVAHKARRGG